MAAPALKALLSSEVPASRFWGHFLVNNVLRVCGAALARDGKYHVRVQTRNAEHRAAQELAQLPNVTFHLGHIESDQLLRESMQGMDAVFFLANGFAIGEKAEIFWSMRAFEIARETGIKYFQFSNLDYSLKKGGYDPKFRCAHYDGKGRVAGESPSLTCNFSHSDFPIVAWQNGSNTSRSAQ